ncbi:hypothetical protein PGR6_19260 [Pseudomonas sp. GR 6-02]|nr:hypothetical protein PGR6_19260 [Pseudomonas sp. GR 6-02]
MKRQEKLFNGSSLFGKAESQTSRVGIEQWPFEGFSFENLVNFTL